jgi:O-antigen/teichoic acid export membrane protein
MVFSHKFLPGVKNKLYWDKAAFKELFSFGKWIFLSSAIGFIATQGDKLILGGLLTVEMLGVYSIAFMLSNLPATIVSQISHKILFPTFSRINRESPGKLKESLIRSKLWLSMLVMPGTGFLIIWSPFIIDYLYDERYEAAGWMMSLLLLRVAVGCMMTPSSLVMMAKGLPQYATISAAFKAIFIFVVLPKVFNQYGMKETIIAIGLSGLIDIPVLWIALIKHKLFSIRIEVLSIILLLAGYLIGFYSMMMI